MSRKDGMHGFTLVELVITLALVAIAATIAVPSFTTLIRNNQLLGQAEEVRSFLQYARSQAVVNRVSYEVKICAGSRWVVRPFAASNANNCTDGTIERELRTDAVAAGLLAFSSAGATVDTIIYRPNGSADRATIVTVCRGGDATTGYRLNLSAAGYLELSKPGKKGGSGNVDMTSCTNP